MAVRFLSTCLLWLLLVFWTASAFTASNNNNNKHKPPSNMNLIILPGFGNCQQDYILSDYPKGSLVQSLQSRGWAPSQINVLNIKRLDWLQVFWRGLWDVSFWQGQTRANGPAFAWYLDKVSETIAASADGPVVLVCHSAGGWLARACLGYCANHDITNRVVGLVSLGAPQQSPPADIMDMTRGALRFTNVDFPGCYYDHVLYMTVAGSAIRGVQDEPSSSSTRWNGSTPTGFAYNSYQAVCGDGTVLGDGVVPIHSSHLSGAIQLTLPNVFHSINAPDQWYGCDAVIDQWHTVLLTELANHNDNNRQSTRGVERPVASKQIQVVESDQV